MSEAGQLAQERWTVRAIQTSATAFNDKPGTDYAIARWGGAPSPVLYSISLACANRIADELNALEARAEAAEQRNPELGYGYWTPDGKLSQGDGESTVMLYKTDELQSQIIQLERRAEADRQRIAELDARLVRCGGENCMGFDASKPGWPVARWVREERLQVAEARIARIDVAWQTWADARVKADREKLEAAEAERNALRARAELAIEAALWAGLYERDILEDPAAELHEWQGFKATWGKSEHSGDCTNQANACLRCHVELVVETAATLTTPAASQEEGS